MFHQYGKKGASSHAKSLKDLIRVSAPESILSEEKRNVLLQEIREACVLETPRFDSLCLTVIYNLINHCQSLPETSNSYYSYSCGLLEHALHRTEAALNLFKDYMILDEKVVYSEEQKLWQYALFTAALLQGIGKLQIDLEVDLYDKNGQFLKPWNPLLENIVLGGSYYSYSFQKESDLEFRRRLNILLARILLPASGFTWIASDPQVLAIWLALLNEDPYAAGTLGAILIRADAIAIQRYLGQWSSKNYGSRGSRQGRPGTFTGGAPVIADVEKQIGIEFVQWLLKALEGGEIMINKAPLLMVPGGLLMHADIFKLFVREHPEYKNWQAIKNGFLSLGFHKMGADGSAISKYEQNDNQQVHSGVVFSEYAIALPAEVPVHHQGTAKPIPMSATEVIHMAQFNNNFSRQQQSVMAQPLQGLNHAGKWQEMNTSHSPQNINKLSGIPSGG